MSMAKRHLEDITYKYLESHPGLGIEDVMEKIVVPITVNRGTSA